MLVLSNTTVSQDRNDVIIRDRATGRVLCEIRLIDIRGQKVRIGYIAPDDVEIQRKQNIHHTG